MSEDLGYSGGDWACCEESVSSSSSNWMGMAGFALGILALGTALYAAFAPRSVVDRTRQKVQSAASKAASKASEVSEKARETVGSHHGSASSAKGTLNCGPGL